MVYNINSMWNLRYIRVILRIVNLPHNNCYRIILDTQHLCRRQNHLQVAIPRQIKCITKTGNSDRYEQIKTIGGDWGKVSESYAISLVENDIYSYFIVEGNNKVNVFVSQYQGKKFLVTETSPDMLLSLDACL